MVWPHMLLIPWRHCEPWSWVDEPRGDPQSPVLSEVEVLELLRGLGQKFVPVVGLEDVATYDRHVNENVQERFEHEMMNEP